MQRAMTMRGTEAVVAIGHALRDLAKPVGNQPDGFENRQFHIPGMYTKDPIEYRKDKVTVQVRWAGIGSDSQTERDGVVVPSSMLYDVRLLHTKNIRGADDPDVYAQNMIALRSMEWFEALAEDRTLVGLLLDCGVEASFTGDMNDSVTQEELYGHEMTIEALIFNR